jgi:predicted Zn-dependent protease
MKKLFILGVALTGLSFSSCTTVPLTGRSRLNLVSDSQVLPMAFQAYGEFLTENKGAVLSASNTQAQQVKRVGNNIIASVKSYMNNNGYGESIKNYQWEVNVVQSKDLNAWCMPGGKIVVYTGILPVTKDERMSKELVSQGVGVAGNVALSRNAQSQSVFNALYGVGTPLVMLKYGRDQELEADRLGLIFMAMAGYNPQSATAFWQRMASASEGSQKPPEFLSTHPSDATRIGRIQNALPEAQTYYKSTTGKPAN